MVVSQGQTLSLKTVLVSSSSPPSRRGVGTDVGRLSRSTGTGPVMGDVWTVLLTGKYGPERISGVGSRVTGSVGGRGGSQTLGEGCGCV